jgi:putative ABC transport system ATP-binding protein
MSSPNGAHQPDDPHRPDDAHQPRGAQPTKPIVEARGLRKWYRTGAVPVEALKGVDVAVQAGEIVAIMGPSGCGKTTLLQCISGLDDFDEGEVWIDGTPLRGMRDSVKADLRARRTGFVFQAYNLLPVLNAVENVELPLLLAGQRGRDARARALRALEEVGLENRARHRPNELSGGQQQRVAIARALVNDPAVVWADEPTGNLDSDSAGDILELLERLNRQNGQTFVLVTHDGRVAERAQRILRMRDGRIDSDERPTRTGSAASTTYSGYAATPDPPRAPWIH